MSDPWEDGLLYDLKNPPVMSMVVSRDDLYTIMATRMGKAADELDRLRAENERLADALLDATAHLTAAASAYQHYAKRHRSLGAPPADALFSTRSKDFDRAAKRARAALAKETGE